MNYDQRITIIRRELVELLGRFSKPRGMADNAEGPMIQSIAESLNRKLPVTSDDQFRENLAKTFAAVLDQHDSYAWPPQALFAKNVCCQGAAPAKAPETFQSQEANRAIGGQMSAGQAVPVRYVWGAASSALVREGVISAELLDSYRRGCIDSFRKLYGSDCVDIMRRQYGEEAARYAEARA